ncbi:C40 family peptidase [Parvibium lacunae]|uniref:Peptidoglycan endopeptidase n=1 Tax=Parvibium lacunae TaxID=1888893 RepID=A0A368L7S1_9BURK|nr:C40 family peptidase [Parvibium lacunae]RCS59289.1 peptidoglycan endopeptidase [Parvibium lacunae]
MHEVGQGNVAIVHPALLQRPWQRQLLCSLCCVIALSLPDAASAAEEPAKDRTYLQEATSRVGDVLLRAMSFLGLPYRSGGNTPETGFDCSGLVRWVFGETLGMSLPRRSEEISQVGAPVAVDQLKPGDLVFFNTLRRTFSHVGIYLGNNRFIHSPSSGSSVRIEDMTTPYWERRFNGARRIVPAAASQEEAARAAAALNGFETR